MIFFSHQILHTKAEVQQLTSIPFSKANTIENSNMFFNIEILNHAKNWLKTEFTFLTNFNM